LIASKTINSRIVPRGIATLFRVEYIRRMPTQPPPPTHWDAERRERIATAVLAGLLGGGDRCGGHAGAAEEVCDFADALMAELDKRATESATAVQSAPRMVADYTDLDAPGMAEALEQDAQKIADLMREDSDALAAAEVRGYARCQADVAAWLRGHGWLGSADDVADGAHVGAAARAAKDGAS
jgi:hypothetical protein